MTGVIYNLLIQCSDDAYKKKLHAPVIYKILNQCSDYVYPKIMCTSEFCLHKCRVLQHGTTFIYLFVVFIVY